MILPLLSRRISEHVTTQSLNTFFFGKSLADWHCEGTPPLSRAWTTRLENTNLNKREEEQTFYSNFETSSIFAYGTGFALEMLIYDADERATQHVFERWRSSNASLPWLLWSARVSLMFEQELELLTDI